MAENKPDETLRLAEIADRNIPGITKRQIAQHVEACLICFDYNKHHSGLELSVKGYIERKVHLYWDEKVDEQIRRGWRDLQEATESGAIAIAILIILKYTEYTIVERSVKGTGFDYWLLEAEHYDDSVLFPKGTARLEVSGILQAATDREIQTRINDKIRQTDVSDETLLPAIIVVVEFNRPEAHLVRKT